MMDDFETTPCSVTSVDELHSKRKGETGDSCRSEAPSALRSRQQPRRPADGERSPQKTHASGGKCKFGSGFILQFLCNFVDVGALAIALLQQASKCKCTPLAYCIA